MKYKPETIEKYLDTARAWLNYYDSIPVEDLHVSISLGNRKIGRVKNVSLLPIVTCAHCHGCRWYCYDIKAALFRTAVMKARARNTSIARRAPAQYWAEIREALRRSRSLEAFRFHVGGDIPGMEYLQEMIKTAEMFPACNFWTYTKETELVNLYVLRHGGNRDCLPANLHIMFSPWNGEPLSNPYDFPVFVCRMEDDARNDYGPEFFDDAWQCPGNCDVCGALGRGCRVGESAWTWEH